MRWTLKGYLDRRVREVPRNPKALLFFNVFFAFAAGGLLVLQLEEGGHSRVGSIFGYFLVALLLKQSLECSYFLLGAIRGNRLSGESES